MMSANFYNNNFYNGYEAANGFNENVSSQFFSNRIVSEPQSIPGGKPLSKKYFEETGNGASTCLSHKINLHFKNTGRIF